MTETETDADRATRLARYARAMAARLTREADVLDHMAARCRATPGLTWHFNGQTAALALCRAGVRDDATEDA